MSLAAALIADFAQETAITKKLLGAVPEEQFDWNPHEKSMTLGELAGHIAENPRWAGAMAEAEMDFAQMPADYEPYVPQSKKELLEKLTENVKVFDGVCEGRDDAFMQETWVGRKGDKVIMSMPRHTALRSIVIHHTVHHRGQLTVYLRLLGVPVPSSYGSTADEQVF